MTALITALLALTSPIDPKVKLIVQKPQAGSNAWDQVVFNDYCYESLKGSGGTENRTRAMFALLGQAASLLAKDDPTGQLSMRSFYRNGKGENVPRLHISVRPSTAQAQAPVMDANAQLAEWSEKAALAGVDFAAVPAAITAVPAAYVGWLKAAVARLNTAAVTAEVAATGNVDTGAAAQEDAPF
jgi:hypothetical protein